MAIVDPQESVQLYLRELRTGDRDNAFHSLIESDPSIVPRLIDEFRRETDAKFGGEILKVIGEFRLPETVPFFAEHLFDGFWKIALDALVIQASPAAVDALQRARERTFDTQEQTTEFRTWLEQAIEQVREAQHR